MPDGSSPRTDIGVCLFLVVVCAAVLWESRKIPPGSFEPLGSAPLPQAVAGLVILLCLIVMGRAWLVLARRSERPREDAGFEPRARDAAATIGLTALYIVAMQLRLTSFAVMTAVFLFVTIGLLVRFERRLLPVAAIVALIAGFGCQYVFTRIFVVDLPGL